MNLLHDNLISLRALEPEDLGLLYRWENDTAQWGTGNTLAPYSKYALREYIAQAHLGIYEQKQLRLMVELAQTKEGVGAIDIYDFEPHHRRAAIGIIIDRHHRQKGYAQRALELVSNYAFTLLKLHQLYAHVTVDNEPSRRLFAHCGFVVTGTLVDWVATNEGYNDLLVMQRTASNKGNI